MLNLLQLAPRISVQASIRRQNVKCLKQWY
jgi:hypothetical protein